MSVKRTPRPQMTRRQHADVTESKVQIMPFYIEKVKRNEDLFQFTTVTLLKIDKIQVHVREMIGGPYRLKFILDALDGKLIVERNIEEGMNTIDFPHNISGNETLRFDFVKEDTVYKNVKGVTCSVILRN
ncbi:hypothetical protein LCGC14_0602350 [marine sediment metagenome]|uniref:Uncharacterized protein n=1 Tax=marine sediment metagenome TaxID=412755 RepID=A0A0F9TWB0_9ZZZZ